MTSLVKRVAVAAGAVARKLGVALDGLGKSIEVTKYTEKLVPSTRFVAVDGVAPTVSNKCFIAPSASVIGDVTIGSECSIWYGAVVRGDVNYIKIGNGTSIGDRAVIHVARIQGDNPTVIGDAVQIGAGALIHAASVGNGCVIGESAQVLDGAKVEANSIITAASVVSPGTVVPPNEVWSGVPARKVRDVTPQEIEANTVRVHETITLALEHAVENSKDHERLAYEQEVREHEESVMDDIDDEAEYIRGTRINNPYSDYLGQGVPGRVFRSSLTHPEEALKLKEKELQKEKERSESK